jgi:small-conductance mechanosensitive channel
MKPSFYEWTHADKRRYTVALVPFVFASIMTTIVLSRISIWLVAAWAGIYLLINVFQAGCCVGCPYRGRYCPAIMGIYLSNWLSHRIYEDREFDQAFFQRNATAAEVVLVVFILFPVYWLWSSAWVLIPAYFALLAAHFVLFMPTQCEHCSFNDTCPGGQTWLNCKRVLHLG